MSKFIKTIILIAFILLSHSSFLLSDTLKLKNGKSIDCDSIWQENSIIKCRRFGHVNVGYPKNIVERIITAKAKTYNQQFQNNKSLGTQNTKTHQTEIIHISINPNNFHPVQMKVAASNIPFTTPLSNKKPGQIIQEPVYHGYEQLYGVLKLGNRKNNIFPFVFDIFESEKMLLYLDLNRNGNLTDDGRLENTGTGRFATRIHIPWKDLIENCPYSGNYVIWFYTNEAGWNRGRLFSHYSRTQLEGTVYIKGVPHKAYLVDKEYNDANLANDGICLDVDRNGVIGDNEKYLHHAEVDNNTYIFEIKW